MKTYRFTLPVSALGLVMATINQCQTGDTDYFHDLKISAIEPCEDITYCDLYIDAVFDCDINNIRNNLKTFNIDFGE